MDRRQRFTKEEAAKLRAAMTAQLSEVGPMTADAMAVAVDCAPQDARDFLARMVKADIALVERRRGNSCRSVIAVYHFNPEQNGMAERKVVVRQQWEPLPVRRGIEWFLFGAPIEMEVA